MLTSWRLHAICGTRAAAFIAVVVLISSGCTHTNGSASQRPSNVPFATISGRLLAVGGPPGVPNRPLAGTVRVDGPKRVDISTGRDGTFTATALPPGRYSLTGHSSSFGGGAVTCHAQASVLVTADAIVTADVYCQEK